MGLRQGLPGANAEFSAGDRFMNSVCVSTIQRRHSLRLNAAAINAALLMVALGFAGSATAQDRTGSIGPDAAKVRPAPAECLPHNAIAATVKSVTDGRTFTLADGRVVRLATIEAPQAVAPDALAALIGGREITLSPLAPLSDRYGRLNMRAFVLRGGAPQLVEAALVAQGFALTMPRAGDAGCTALLMAAERVARAGKLGLWADPSYSNLQAENPAAVLAAQGRFAVVEGKVLSVRRSGGTVYVNFGRRWSEDMTVTILKRNERKFTAAGIEPEQLKGRKVRVRGFVEERGGPWIEASLPEQIEIVEDR